MGITIPKALKKWDFLFFILLFGICLLYSYHTILFMRPYSLHQWRQCDCLSLTYNYYTGGMHFFSPAVNICGPTGDNMTCTSECPLIYFTVALLWKIFGYHEFIYRLVDVTIAFAGLYALFRLTKELIEDCTWALMVGLCLMASPIFAVYANNFIMDVPALSIALIGWYFFVRYYKTKRMRFYNLSMFFFLLAGLTKISALLSVVPLIIIFLWELFRRNKTTEEKLFINPLKQAIPLLMLVVVLVSWTAYSIHYNSIHNSELHIFSTGIFPIWQLDKAAILDIADKFYHNLLPQYFKKSFILLTLALFAFMMLNFKKMNRFYSRFIFLVFLGCILYLVLWFQVLDVHDYYLVNLLIFIPATIVVFLVFIKEYYPSVFNSKISKIVFALILSWNIYYCAVETNVRYSATTPIVTNNFVLQKPDMEYWKWFHWSYGNSTKAFETITPYLRSIGIVREDRVISLPDESIDISLYLMDQKGFTGYEIEDGHGFKPDDKENTMKKLIGLGAKYLILSDTSYLNRKWIKPYSKNKIGAYQNISIYDLRAL